MTEQTSLQNEEEEKKSERTLKKSGGGIKTVVYDIVIGPNGAAVFLTDKISGILKIIMLRADLEIPCKVRIVPEGLPEFKIIDDWAFKGFKSYPVKLETINAGGIAATSLGTPDMSEIALDERLEVTIEGAAANKIISLLVRYHNA